MRDIIFDIIIIFDSVHFMALYLNKLILTCRLIIVFIIFIFIDTFYNNTYKKYHCVVLMTSKHI